ncbi:leucine-rich repeat extensin-like protein 6 [Pecten maximus]|uniref:leucine-rich repeat extensin-like protein 6 n=1 Tax=Pecten maximus TaxID=6579 RepID=UPI0014590942|nr:leucine-rich repeat extensin-like protein 6 [Pecten maximus]
MTFGRIFVFLSLTSVTHGWDYCYYNYYSYIYKEREVGQTYCDTSCCGSSHKRHCCSYDGAKAGAIVGGLICIVVIIGILACCLKSHYFRSRRAVRPLQPQDQVTSGNITIIQTPAMMAMPPPYSSYQTIPNGVPPGPAPPYQPPTMAPPGYVAPSSDVGPLHPPPYTGPPPKY